MPQPAAALAPFLAGIPVLRLERFNKSGNVGCPKWRGKEAIWLPADTPEEDVMDEIEQLIGRLSVPFKEVRVYREQDLFYKERS